MLTFTDFVDNLTQQLTNAYHACTQLHSRNGLEVPYQENDDNEVHAINESLHEMLKLSEDMNGNYAYEHLPNIPTYDLAPIAVGGY